MNHLTWDPTPFFEVLGPYAAIAMALLGLWTIASVSLLVYLGNTNE